MCDQTEVTYHDGDVVWVKIGPIWWPGVVKDVEKDGSGSEILAGLRTKPIAVVKFFDEDAYEFVKNLDNIYHYNCRRKDEFIKKGLEKYRKGTTHMKKFPEDVKRAQRMVNEDENIVNSPKYAPVERVNYNDIFGTSPKKKEKKDDLALRTKILPLKKRLSAPVTVPKYRGTNSCPKCDFSIDNVDILRHHIKYTHSSERVDYSVPGRTKPPPEPKRRNTTVPKIRKKSIPKEATPKAPKVKVDAEEKIEEAAPKESPVPATKPSMKSEKSGEKKKRYTDVLLADWSEDDQNREDEEEEVEEEKPKTDLNENNSNSEVVEGKKEKEDEEKKPPRPVQPVAKTEAPSCFDFDEEDDGFIGMSNANTYGRKIPRVIPDKIELGMDPEIEELFKRKPESEQEEEIATPPAKKRRGRPPKNLKPVAVPPPKISPKPVDDSLATTRERRPGALKSYIGEVIEKIPTADEGVDDEPPKPPSRRKQDLKRQSLKELDELEAIVASKRRTERADVDYMPPLNTRLTPKKKDPELEAQKKRLNDFHSIEMKTEALLAELTSVTPKIDLSDECMDGTVEYLEDEPEPVLQSPGKGLSPIKKWKEDIRLAMDSDSPVKKSIPQWKQDIQEAMKANKEPQPIKKIVFSGKSLEPGTSNLVKVSKLTNKGNNTLVIMPESRKIINKQQQVVFLSKQQAINKPIVMASKPQTTKVATQPFLKLISDGHGGTKKVVSQKVVQIGSKASPSTYVLSGTKRESGIHVMRNFNGTGKTVILGGGAGQTVYRRLKNVQTTTSPGTSTGKSTQCIVKTVKAPLPQYKTVRLFSSDKPQTIVPQQRQYILKTSEPKPIKITQSEPEPVVQQVVQVQPQSIAVSTQQVVAMQNPEGQTTYMLVTVDSSGNVQQLDSSLLTYDVQPEVAPQLYESATDDLTPTYSSAGQDILAEALANTNVLESEMPLTSLIIPSMEGQSVLSDNPGLISKPHVQETSVTLQNPIMSPVEVPSSIVPDTTGLQPPPLPPTPTEEDVLLEETDGSLMIAEQEQQQQTETEVQQQMEGQVVETPEEHFFIDDSQEGEANTFQSMPLLTEDATTAEEPIGDQQFTQPEQDVATTEYLSSSTTAHIEEQVAQEDLSKFEQGLPEVSPGMYTNDGSQLIFVQDQPTSLGDVTTEGDSTNQAQDLE